MHYPRQAAALQCRRRARCVRCGGVPAGAVPAAATTRASLQPFSCPPTALPPRNNLFSGQTNSTPKMFSFPALPRALAALLLLVAGARSPLPSDKAEDCNPARLFRKDLARHSPPAPQASSARRGETPRRTPRGVKCKLRGGAHGVRRPRGMAWPSGEKI